MRTEKGFSLIEVIIALALMGIIAVAFLGGLGTASKATFVADERATAESLARSQMEAVKKLNYVYAPGGGEATYANAKIGVPSANYEIRSLRRSGIEDTTVNIIAVPWDSAANQAVTTDVGLQRIKLAIYHKGKLLFTLEDYKVDR